MSSVIGKTAAKCPRSSLAAYAVGRASPASLAAGLPRVSSKKPSLSLLESESESLLAPVMPLHARPYSGSSSGSLYPCWAANLERIALYDTCTVSRPDARSTHWCDPSSTCSSCCLAALTTLAAPSAPPRCFVWWITIVVSSRRMHTHDTQVPAMRRASAAKKLSHHKGTEPDTSDGTGPLTGKVISDPV